MSYILDALKKADAERELGGVPGLHARQVAPTPAARTPTGRTGLWLALIAALVLAGVGTMVWMGHAPVEVAVPAPAAALPPPASAPLPAPAPVVVAPTAPAVVTAPVTAPPPPVAKPEPRTPAKPVANTVASVPQPAPKTSAATPPAEVAVAPLLSELPADIRGQIPALAISGSVYSENPSQRLLLINGLVLPQGGQVAPDVSLLEIHRSSSEFSFRGMRFQLAY